MHTVTGCTNCSVTKVWWVNSFRLQTLTLNWTVPGQICRPTCGSRPIVRSWCSLSQHYTPGVSVQICIQTSASLQLHGWLWYLEICVQEIREYLQGLRQLCGMHQLIVHLCTGRHRLEAKDCLCMKYTLSMLAVLLYKIDIIFALLKNLKYQSVYINII